MAWECSRGRGMPAEVREDGLSQEDTAQQKFQEARALQQAAIQQHVKLESLSSVEEEDYVESENILGSVLRSFSQLGGARDDLGRTQELLEDLFVSGATTCPVCIASVKRTDPVWNCEGCHNIFHLTCIQRWSEDTVAEQRPENYEPPSDVEPEIFKWDCPKCRRDYTDEQIPKSYLCFCGQAVDPPHQPWLLPHSCGETCGRPLQPACGHECLLLCHPGPCPPCPRMVSAKCRCGRSEERELRCSRRDWGCAVECKMTLQCGHHQCSQLCHPGECQPCIKVCGKELVCGQHNCQRVCHSGECGGCPLGEPRTCPCGKTTHHLPCTIEEVPLCWETCARPMECGEHSCPRPCHRDDCGSCLAVVERRCRCYLHCKELPCQEEYLCNTKCKKFTNCGRHRCSRECCDGLCRQCDTECGRTLRCGKHKCPYMCHRGSCSPCEMTVTVPCRCGQASVSVPCSPRKKAESPRCSEPCRLSPDCHHERREPHPCHTGDCPPCIQKCSKFLPSCPHSCPAPCHSAVPVQDQGEDRFAELWEVLQSQLELRSLPCPPCMVPVAVTCPGGHETCDLPCSSAEPRPCGRTCGRLLPCGKHTCSRPCHTVSLAAGGDLSKSGLECGDCEERCWNARPEGCSHSCPLPCHPGDCPPCSHMLRFTCHCGDALLWVRCGDWTVADHDARLTLRCCGSQCLHNCCDGACPPCEKKCGRTLRCGQHKCARVCHRGPCYPCPLTATVSCRCGQTSVSVPCGHQKKAEPPLCSRPCRLVPDCHHERPEYHRCHPGDCPPCTQKCSKSLPGCPHSCPAPCHFAVPVQVQEGHRFAELWEVAPPQLELRRLPCPPCMVPVTVTCLGGHETCDQPCSSADLRFCGRACGRLLPCDKHACSRPCHTVSFTVGGDPSKSGLECGDCEEGCLNARPDGCSHSCPLPCHPGDCPPCSCMVRLTCHCGQTQLWVRCSDWTVADHDVRRALQCCKNECPRNFECGHGCREYCHPGDCPGPERCRRKVKVYCSCRRLRKQFPCDQVRAGLASLPCDDVCRARKQEQLQAQEEQDRRRRQEEELRNQQELERFNRKFLQPQKKHKERSDPGDTSTRGSLLYSTPAFILGLLAALVLAVYLAWPRTSP